MSVTEELINEINLALKKGLDKEVDEPESVAAWMHARDLMVKNGLGVHCLVGEMPDDATEQQFGDDGEIVLNFGKWGGVTLGEIALNNPQYLVWMYNQRVLIDRKRPDWHDAVFRIIKKIGREGDTERRT